MYIFLYYNDQKRENALFFNATCTHEHSLTHEGIGSICSSIQEFTEAVCQNVARKLKNSGINADDTTSICNPGSLFEGLTTRHLREKYYEENFNYKVHLII